MDKTAWIQDRIFDADRVALLRKCRQWKLEGSTIVFTNGCFDILHRGHLDYLVRAAALGNKLVIGVNTDASVKRLKGPERPINKEKDRLFGLASLLAVDAVCLFEEDTPLELIMAVEPDVLVKGGDYTVERIAGAAEVMSRGGRVEVISFVEGYSTTGVIERMRKFC